MIFYKLLLALINFGSPRYKIPPRSFGETFIRRYQRFRMSLDNMVSYGYIGIDRKKNSLIKNFNLDDLIDDGYIKIPNNFEREVKVFNKFLGRICNDQFLSDAGAEMKYFSGKLFSEKLKNRSYAKYYPISHNREDLEDVRMFINENFINDELIYILSVLSGYMVEVDDISYNLGIVSGENSNSEWHSDVFCNTAKAFLYLKNVDSKNSPFEFFIGSNKDVNFRARLDSKYKKKSARLYDINFLDESKSKFKLVSGVGAAGTFIVANTSGLHRKGLGDLHNIRYSLNFGTVRYSIFKKLYKNLKYRISN